MAHGCVKQGEHGVLIWECDTSNEFERHQTSVQTSLL